MDDLVLRGGTVVDGTGGPARVADVAVRDGLITAVGTDVPHGRREIDATGLLVTPGFVDIHTHYDGQVTWDPLVAPSSVNGVTSMAMGNCGVGFAPVRPDRHDWLIGLLEGVEDIPGTALAEGLAWDWETFPEYLDAVDRRPHVVDVGVHVPHAAVRAYVMGERGADHAEEPSDDEVAEMGRVVGEGLDAGAVGFATSRTILHRTRDGANIGTLRAPEEELLGVARAMRQRGRGVIQLISDAYLTADDEFAAAELALIRRLAVESGRPLSFTVQQVDKNPDRWRQLFGHIDQMVGEGLTVRGQVAPRPIGILLGLQCTLNPFSLTPSYRRLSRLPLDERVAALRTPEVRDLVVGEHADARRDGMVDELTQGFHKMYVLGDPVDYEPRQADSVAARAAAAARPPADVAFDLMLSKDGTEIFYVPFNNYAAGNLDAVREMMVAPHAIYGLSDGGAHCGAICDASFPTTTLQLWGRDRTRGERIPLELLVHGYTARNARHVGWLDRGVLAPGYLADVNVIDFERLAARPPRIVHDLPAGGRRLLQDADGYRYTLKRGEVTFEDGEHTGPLPGHLVRGATPAPA